MVADFKIVRVTIPLNGSIVGRTIGQLNIPEECRIVDMFREDRLAYPDESFVFKGRDSIMLCAPGEGC